MENKKTKVTFNKSFATDLPEDVTKYFAENIAQECVALFRMTCKTWKEKVECRHWGMPYKHALESPAYLKFTVDCLGLSYNRNDLCNLAAKNDCLDGLKWMRGTVK